MVKRPKISVIIPIYNVENYLSRCLESVIDQTLLDIEIIAVNDGTKDHSVDIVKKYMDIDSRIQLVEKPNGGLASARNAGIDVATGEVILFLDSDDYLSLEACERIYEEYLDGHPDIVVFGSKPFPEVPEPDPWVVWRLTCRDRIYETFEPDVLFKEPCGQPFAWNRAFSADFLKNHHLKFSEKVLFGEDIVFLFEVVPMAKGIHFIKDQLHFYQSYRQGSLMDRYGKDAENKMWQHIKNIHRITRYWYEKGWIERWGKEFFQWAVEFICVDLVKYEGANRREMALKTLKILHHYGVDAWKDKAGFRYKAKYRRMIRMARKNG